ncbi:MAG TPA: HNH endonuclease [Archangium sp.]|jgi:putative restriction endonuclease|uniref:HNH endonuclease n=1 Tax=Archangium sp. TaxID=1872627 RepID=UPI002ED8F328
MPLPTVDPDWEIRATAFQTLEWLVTRHGPTLAWDVIQRGFDFKDQHLHFATKARGIFRPKEMRGEGPLSIKTIIPRGNRPVPYEESQKGVGVFVYKLQGNDPDNRDNQLLQWAWKWSVPLIYFYAVEVGVYQPIWPIFIRGIDRERLECTLSVDDEVLAERERSVPMVADARAIEIRRQYVTVQAKRRLHQSRFRLEVLRAYEQRCAVCRLPRPELLDAAHIVADREETGDPVVPNGLALCRLHHGVFDTDLMGIRPDGVIELSQSLIETRDGPTLEHAVKAFQGQHIHLPRLPRDQPGQRFLEARYERFRKVG